MQAPYAPQVAQAAAMLKAQKASQASQGDGQAPAYAPQGPQAPQQPQAFPQDAGGQGAGGSGPSSMDALMAQHQADNLAFQQRAQAMLAVHQAATQAQWAKVLSASRQAQLQAAQDNPGAADALQRLFAIQDRTAGSF